MGRGNGAVPGGSFQTYYNAAASSFTEGANAAYTKLEPNTSDFTKDWCYYNYGASYNTGKYGALAFNYFRYTYGKFIYNDPFNPGEQSFEPVNEIFSINYSYKFANDLAVGVNGNFFHYEMTPKAEGNTFFFDLGAIKKFSINHSVYKQDIYAAVSINNILNRRTATETETTDEFGNPYTFEYIDYLPSTLRISGAYEIKYDPEG
ncbi:MAG TPA: hypothetical protein VHO28_05075, partial [Ignavibacteriales bacterium]|nr:hypothetical protein [Ignavibacteriales bacterium]